MTNRITGPDCEFMYNFRNTHTHTNHAVFLEFIWRGALLAYEVIWLSMAIEADAGRYEIA